MRVEEGTRRETEEVIGGTNTVVVEGERDGRVVLKGELDEGSGGNERGSGGSGRGGSSPLEVDCRGSPSEAQLFKESQGFSLFIFC